MRLTIMSRRECHLCHVVARVAAQVQEDLAFHLTIVDIDTDEQLRRQYGDRIPVVLLDDRELLSGKVTAGDLRKAIKKARWRDPISRILSRIKLALTRG
ncbi:MAG: glutaredoxin family protein [Nitrospira sp.]|nr:glutaredoxin family protein [Nitrospira sp.]HNE31312.1 glutaredoxin family protein [Nitrospira sp.]